MSNGFDFACCVVLGNPLISELLAAATAGSSDLGQSASVTSTSGSQQQTSASGSKQQTSASGSKQQNSGQSSKLTEPTPGYELGASVPVGGLVPMSDTERRQMEHQEMLRKRQQQEQLKREQEQMNSQRLAQEAVVLKQAEVIRQREQALGNQATETQASGREHLLHHEIRQFFIHINNNILV